MIILSMRSLLILFNWQSSLLHFKKPQYKNNINITLFNDFLPNKKPAV